jgi:hypothetical protein
VLTPAPQLRASADVVAHSHQQVMQILTNALLGTDDSDGGHEEEDITQPVEYGDSIKGSGEISDAEASILFPPKTAEERDRQQAIRRQLGKVRASALEPWDDEDLHARLFGTTTGKDAGCWLGVCAAASISRRLNWPRHGARSGCQRTHPNWWCRPASCWSWAWPMH